MPTSQMGYFGTSSTIFITNGDWILQETPHAEQADVVRCCAIKRQIRQNPAYQNAKLEAVTGKTRADNNVSIAGVTIYNEVFVGGHGVQTGAAGTQPSISQRQMAAQEGAHYLDMLRVDGAWHGVRVDAVLCIVDRRFQAAAINTWQAVIPGRAVCDKDRKMFRLELADVLSPEVEHLLASGQQRQCEIKLAENLRCPASGGDDQPRRAEGSCPGPQRH